MDRALRLPALREHAAALRAACRFGIELTCTRTPESEMSPGRSRIGGRPDLPDALAWPVVTAQKLGEQVAMPLTFVGQIALRDIAEHDMEDVLPHDGLLSIFVIDELRLYDSGLQLMSSQAHERTRVLYFADESELRRRDAPADLPAKHTLPTSRVSFRRVVTWPQGEGTVIGNPNRSPAGGITLSEEAWQAWAEHAPPSPDNLILGHPCGCEYPIGSSPDARLLLSLDARSSGIDWTVTGRNGFLFVGIPQASLVSRRWEDATHKEW
jgi:hypothetical protein